MPSIPNLEKNGYRLKEHCQQCASKSPLFRLLSAEELDMMNLNRHEVMYKPGETIFKQNAPLTHVLSFNYGLAKILVEGPGGSNIILRLAKPVEFIYGMGLFSDSKNQFSLLALERSSVCYIRRDNFISVLYKNTVFMEAFFRHMENFQAANMAKMISLNKKHSGGRVAESLLYLSNDIYATDTFDSHLSTQELADLSGISRESAFKIMNDLTNQEIINREGKTISIRNRQLLEKISING